MPDQNRYTVCLVTALLLYLPIFSFLNSNYYPILSPENITIFSICALVSLLAFVATFVLPKILVSVFVALLLALVIESVYAIPNFYMLYAICVLFALLTARKTANFILAGCVTFIFTSLVQNLVFITPASESAKNASSKHVGNKEIPFVLHVVLDEHLGIASMHQASASTSEFSKNLVTMLRREGFEVYRNAYSQYWGTQNSLPNLLNLSSLSTQREFLREGNTKRVFPLRTTPSYTLDKSAYFEQMTQRGYKIRIYQSQFMDFCNVVNAEIASCVTYGGQDIDVISRAALSVRDKLEIIAQDFIEASNTSGIRRLVSTYNRVAGANLKFNLPKWEEREQRGRYALASLEAVSQLSNELENAKKGEMIFAHLLIPHFPYIFYPDCTVKPGPRSWLWFDKRPDEVPHANDSESRMVRYEAYVGQLQCTKKLIHQILRGLEKSGQLAESTVIIHGDHGSRIYINEPRVENLGNITSQDMSDAYSTLFAVKRAGSRYQTNDDFLPLQILLNDTLELDSKPIPSGVYLNEQGTLNLTLHRSFEWELQSAQD